MTQLKQLFERQDKEFEEKFGISLDWGDVDMIKKNDLKSHITQSKLEVVKAVMERIEQLKFNFETQDFVEQIENLYDQLQSELNEIEKKI